jgi:predicted nucleic acid-binding protein
MTMTSKVDKIYWDSTAFICFLKRTEGERRRVCEDVLYHARDGSVQLFTSTFTLAEVIRPQILDSVGTRLISPEEIAEIQGMFQWPWIKKVDLDQRVARKAVDIERDYGLGTADSIHVASALIARADVLQHWERKDEFGKIGRLIAVEHPRMLTYGAVATMPTLSHAPEFPSSLSPGRRQVFRSGAAVFGQHSLRARSRQ